MIPKRWSNIARSAAGVANDAARASQTGASKGRSSPRLAQSASQRSRSARGFSSLLATTLRQWSTNSSASASLLLRRADDPDDDDDDDVAAPPSRVARNSRRNASSAASTVAGSAVSVTTRAPKPTAPRVYRDPHATVYPSCCLVRSASNSGSSSAASRSSVSTRSASASPGSVGRASCQYTSTAVVGHAASSAHCTSRVVDPGRSHATLVVVSTTPGAVGRCPRSSSRETACFPLVPTWRATAARTVSAYAASAFPCTSTRADEAVAVGHNATGRPPGTHESSRVVAPTPPSWRSLARGVACACGQRSASRRSLACRATSATHALRSDRAYFSRTARRSVCSSVAASSPST
mmetsp:Transcript_4608/g.18748  ORF Transcript_4608/g.18748 Transcript_4608/m.18748 type:complete len:352 (+) Transcript_4608:2241-3296(+)